MPRNYLLFRTDDMYYSLSFVPKAEICQAKSLDILFQGKALCARIGLLHKLCDVLEVFARGGRYVLSVVSLSERSMLRAGEDT